LRVPCREAGLTGKDKNCRENRKISGSPPVSSTVSQF
jgi:hypothetical protein